MYMHKHGTGLHKALTDMTSRMQDMIASGVESWDELTQDDIAELSMLFILEPEYEVIASEAFSWEAWPKVMEIYFASAFIDETQDKTVGEMVRTCAMKYVAGEIKAIFEEELGKAELADREAAGDHRTWQEVAAEEAGIKQYGEI
jgi:hypothetical protein